MNRRGMRTVEVDENRRELSPHGTLMLPLQINHDDLSAFLGGGIICHWHEELEFSIVLQGTARYVLGKGVHLLSPGDGVLINSNVPHAIFPCGAEPAQLLTVIVHPAFLYGFQGSAIESGLLRPFLGSPRLSVVRLEEEETQACRSLAQLESRQAFAWELEAKSLLCHAVYALLLRHQHELRRGRPYAGADLQRLHALLRALSERYGEPLALEEMARIAGLSRESCCRFFKRMTGETLSQYLEEYRVAQGLALLQRGEMSVTEIALHCGFSNAGRFSAAFCRRMHCTPREYLSRCRSGPA